MAGGDRSPRRDQSSASEAGACDQNGTEVSASSATAAEILGTEEKNEEALDLIRAGKRTAEEAGPCDLNGEEGSALAATAEIIRTKKKEVLDLLRAKKRMYEEAKPAGTAGGTEDEKNGAPEKKKRKKVVKFMFPQAAIDLLFLMVKRPIDVIPDDSLAKYSQRYRDIFDINMSISKKTLEYDQAIIDQYLQLGYAVDETEVTDDEDETVGRES